MLAHHTHERASRPHTSLWKQENRTVSKMVECTHSGASETSVLEKTGFPTRDSIWKGAAGFELTAAQSQSQTRSSVLR